MSDKQIFYSKIIIAQIGAFFISSFLVKEVFLGGIPVVQPEFKREVKESPQMVKATIDSAVAVLQKESTSVITREDYPDEKDSAGTSPPPWIFEPFLTEAVTQIPTPTSMPVQPSDNPTQASPTRGIEGTPTSFPIPSWMRNPNPTTPPIPPTSRPLSTVRPLPTATTAPVQNPPPSTGNDSLEEQTIALINQRRQEAGLGSLTKNAYLTAAARKHSADMTSKGFCSHTGSDGSDPNKRARDAGYPGNPYGETIGCGHQTAQSIVNGWWESPGHKEILTNGGIRSIGVGWVGSNQTALVGQ